MQPSKHIRRFLCFSSALLFFSTLVHSPVYADEDGRYRAVVLQEGGASSGGGSLTPRIFIIDSREGHMWTWEKNMPLVGAGSPSFGSIITYQGQVKPGKKIGEVVGQGEIPQ